MVGLLKHEIYRVDFDNSVEYRLNTMAHRTNGPAYFHKAFGWWSWWLYDKEHRYYGPRIFTGSWAIHGETIK